MTIEELITSWLLVTDSADVEGFCRGVPAELRAPFMLWLMEMHDRITGAAVFSSGSLGSN